MESVTNEGPENANSDGELSTLYNHLDLLWTRYLNLLNEYCAAQENIKKNLAAGFFSLAHANFHSSGRRYGQDYYDQRAIATVRADVRVDQSTHGLITLRRAEDEKASRHRESTTSNAGADQNGIGDGVDAIDLRSNQTRPAMEETDSGQLPSPSPTPDPTTPIQGDKEATTPDFDSDVKSMSKGQGQPEQPSNHVQGSTVDTHDPIRWFGILVPPSLRSAQRSFAAVMKDNGGVAEAVNASRALREAEFEIRKTRKAIRKVERSAHSKQTHVT